MVSYAQVENLISGAGVFYRVADADPAAAQGLYSSGRSWANSSDDRAASRQYAGANQIGCRAGEGGHSANARCKAGIYGSGERRGWRPYVFRGECRCAQGQPDAYVDTSQ